MYYMSEETHTDDSVCSTPSSVYIDMTKNDSIDNMEAQFGVKEPFVYDDENKDSLSHVESLDTIDITTPPVSVESAVVVTDSKPFISQDTSQKLGVASIVAVEIYRALVASFLILFVPQSCGDHVCSFSENAETGPDPLYNAGFVFNCITMAAFSGLYYVEVRREGKLIAYLDVNTEKPSDNASVGIILTKLPKYCSDSILYYDSLYIKAGYFVIGCFIINSILSGLVVYKYYLDDKTTTTYITSVLFVVQKLLQVYATLNTEKNVFYSAYLSGKIQYNDVDKDKMIEDKAE